MTSITNRHQLQKTKVVVGQSREEWTTREKLILASAVLRSGDQNWVSVSRAIKPLMDRNRGLEFFSQKNCAAQYSKMLEKVSTPKRKRSNIGGAETPGEQIVRRLTYDRIEELKRSINDDHATYRKLKKEEQKMISGKLDSSLPAIWSEIQAQKRAAKEADDIIESVEVTTPVHDESTTELINTPLSEDHKVDAEVQQEKLSPSEESTESDNVKSEAQLIDTNSDTPNNPTENEKLKDANQDDKSSQLSQNTVNEIEEPNENPIIKVAEPNSPQNTREVEATLAVEAETDDIKKEKDNINLLGNDDDTTKQVDKLLHDNEKEREESTPVLSNAGDIVRENTTLLQQAVTALHRSDTKDLIRTRSPLIASLLLEPSKCGKQLIATQPPFKPEQFNELGKVLEELNKENAAADYPHLKTYWSRSTYEEIIQQLSGMSSAQRKVLMNTVVAPERIVKSVETSTVGAKAETHSALTSLDFDGESVETFASKLSDIFKSGTSSSRTAAAAATIAAYLGDSKFDGSSSETNKLTDSDNTTNKSTNSESASGDVAIAVERYIKSEVQDEELDQELENKFKSVQASTESTVVDVETVDPEPPPLRESPTLRITRSCQTRGTTKAPKEKNKKPVKGLRRSRRSKPKSSTADQESIEGDEDKDSLAEDDSIKHDESDDDRKSRSSDLTFEDDPREIDDGSEHVPRRRTGSDSFPSSPSSISQSDDLETTQARKNWKKAIMLMYRDTAALKCASIFLHPVTDDEAPGYHEIVKRPIDLSTIRKLIDNGTIRTNLEFQRYVMLMFQNALMYNNSNHVIHQMAEEMFNDFDERFQIFLTTQEMVQSSENKTLRASGGLRRGEHPTKGEGRGLRRGPPDSADHVGKKAKRLKGAECTAE